jgi:asparagine synthase (glutamine-hydrolysing)
LHDTSNSPRGGATGAGSVQSAPWISAAERVPYVHIRYAGGQPVVTGSPRSFVGHRMGPPDRPSGNFAQWEWDGTSLRASVDPLGFFSLFVYVKGREIAVSPSILHLLEQGADPEPDPVAMAVFHRVGFFADCDTPFRHIRVLPAGGQLVWRDGVATITGGPPPPRESSLTRSQAVEAFIEMPRAIIRRFLASWDGPVVLPLSGGRDSRHVLLEMAHQGRKPDTCVTYHHSGRILNDEVQAARAIAERVGVRHTILGRPRKRLRDSLRAILMTQLCADEHSQMMPMHDYLAGSPAAAIDGIGGDILTNPDDSAADFMKRARRGDYHGIARSMAEGHGRVISRPGYRGGAGAIHSPELHEEAIDRIATLIRKFDPAPDPYQAFWFWNRTRREISFVSTAVLGGAAMVFCPYLDADFVDLGLSLPWSVTCDQKLHDDAIARAFPAYSDVPFADAFRSQPLSPLRIDRVTNALDCLRVAAMSQPGTAAIAAMWQALKPSGLRRGQSDIYRLQKQFVDDMDAAEARRLIRLWDRLDREMPKGQGVVTDVYHGV